MNIERSLLNRVITDRDIHLCFDKGVNQSWFNDSLDKKVWSFVVAHFATYSEVPSADVVIENFPEFVLVPEGEHLVLNDSISYLIDQLIERRKKLIVARTAEVVVTSIQVDAHEDAIMAMQKALIDFELEGLNSSNDIDIVQTIDDRIQRYEDRKKNPGGLLGLSTGFPTIDRACNGIQKKQMVTIIATPKVGKSLLAMQMAFNMWRKDGIVPLFWSFEMTNREQEDRFDSMFARISQQRLMTGALVESEELRWRKVLEDSRVSKPPFLLSDSSSGATLSQMASKLSVKKPDILIIDGMYLMIDEQAGKDTNQTQSLTNLTRGIKRLAMNHDIPILVTTQALEKKKEGGRVTANSIGYTSSFYQDSDVILSLERDDNESEFQRKLSIVASRNTGNATVPLRWEFDSSTFRELEIEEDEI